MYKIAILITIAGLAVYSLIRFTGSLPPDLTIKHEIITLPPSTFDLEVKVLITDDTSFARSYVMENLDSTVDTEDFDCRASTFGTIDGKPPIIWLPYKADVSIINHELFHATVNIMHWAGILLSDQTEEAYAYQLQYLSQQLDNQINITK